MPGSEPVIPVWRYLCISTAHISSRDDTLLANTEVGVQAAPLLGKLPGGWLFYVPPQEMLEEVLQTMSGAGFTPEFCELFRWAFAKHCRLLRLDADEPTIAGLPTFDWDAELATDRGADKLTAERLEQLLRDLT